jgi:site-specific DNA-methyltransferase (adenine-specific)
MREEAIAALGGGGGYRLAVERTIRVPNKEGSSVADMSVHFMSQRLDWQTPEDVYDKLDAEFHFDHDPCPPNPTVDGLTSEWGSSNFVNPPYGREIPKWIKKGYKESLKGKTVVFLIPSRTDTRWWHDYVMKADEIRFIKGRLKFKGAKQGAPFPSAIIVFRAALKGGE